MKKTNHVQPAIAARMPWRAGCYVADYELLMSPGQHRNAVLFSDALFRRLVGVRT